MPNGDRMTFKLSRKLGDAFEIHGVLIEISEIKETTVIFAISSDSPVRVRYKELTGRAKSNADTDAQQRALEPSFRKQVARRQ